MQLRLPRVNTPIDLLKNDFTDEGVLVGQFGAALQVLRGQVVEFHHAPAAEEEVAGLVLFVVELAQGVAAADVVVEHLATGVHFVL